MTRLIQIKKGNTRRVAVVQEPQLRLLGGCSSIYTLANSAIASGMKLSEAVRQRITQDALDYDDVYNLKSEWHVLPAMDHPEDPARCLVSGTGLTHLGSARSRQNMHSPAEEVLTDSMKMFRWGVEGGRPSQCEIGAAPEWFYKGNGMMLRAHGEPLDRPAYAEDGGEEGEIAGIYVIDPEGHPRRVGMTTGNEFSDHRFEKRNYLNLAGSKLRNCAIGPELVIDPEFQSVDGKVVIERAGQILWSKQIKTGEAEMCHSLQNIEHHHFKFEGHRRPGDVHIHFFGADSLSFGDGIELSDGDVMQVSFEGFGRALRNRMRTAKTNPALVEIKSLE
ncbi:MAG TPA: AraD1 family protein [Terriglobales bacterium]|jgi:hypothetical protein